MCCESPSPSFNDNANSALKCIVSNVGSILPNRYIYRAEKYIKRFFAKLHFHFPKRNRIRVGRMKDDYNALLKTIAKVE